MSLKDGPILSSVDWPHGAVLCDRCGSTLLKSPLVCGTCGSDSLASVDLTGNGRVEAVTSVPERYSPPNEGVIRIALVRLTQGPLVLARSPGAVEIGDGVELELIASAMGDFIPSIRRSWE